MQAYLQPYLLDSVVRIIPPGDTYATAVGDAVPYSAARAAFPSLALQTLYPRISTVAGTRRLDRRLGDRSARRRARRACDRGAARVRRVPGASASRECSGDRERWPSSLLANACLLAAGIGVTGLCGWWGGARGAMRSLGVSYLVGLAAFGVIAQLAYVLGASLALWQVVRHLRRARCRGS